MKAKNKFEVKSKKEKVKNMRNFINSRQTIKQAFFAFLLFTFAFFSVQAQTEQPEPSAPKSVKIPAVKEKSLPNGLKVAVVERRNVPLVTVQLLVKAGAEEESIAKAGLADMTAQLLTKGTKTRSATEIAEEMEFLGGLINTWAVWNSSAASVNVVSDKLERALAIMADTVLNPVFKQEEIDLLKSQMLDGLAYNLKQPSFLANYVASKYSFNEHPAAGTPGSIEGISRDDIVNFHKQHYSPQNAVLIFTGDITEAQAGALAQKYFGNWKKPAKNETQKAVAGKNKEGGAVVKRILVIDLPNSGQAAVSYVKRLDNVRRIRDDYYYPSSVLNSLLGGGYSSRLNQEIRIKRGLSYGAGSSFAWRDYRTNFATRTQTKNESAAEVAELVVAEIKKLKEGEISDTELNPRKFVLTGSFGRNLETTGGLASALAELYSFDLPTANLNSYMDRVQSVTGDQVKEFAGENFSGGDLIIVGDFAKFKEDLAKRFPNVKVEVIPASELDLSRENLRKSGNTAVKN